MGEGIEEGVGVGEEVGEGVALGDGERVGEEVGDGEGVDMTGFTGTPLLQTSFPDFLRHVNL